MSVAASAASTCAAAANRALPGEGEADADVVGVLVPTVDGTVPPTVVEDEDASPPRPRSHPPAAPATATASSPATAAARRPAPERCGVVLTC